MLKWIFTLLLISNRLLWAQEMPKQITIGFIPSTSTEKLKIEALELATELQNRLQIPVNIYISKNYTGLVDAMKDQKVDFAFLSPFTFVMAEKAAQARVLMKKVYEEPFYYSVLAVLKKSGITKVEQLKDKKIAFVDEKSTSGYLYPLSFFKKNKINYKDFFKKNQFSGNHKSSVELLDQGQVDAVAVFSDDETGAKSALTQFGGQVSHYKLLWVSEPIPNDPFCVRGAFYDKYPRLTHALMMDLIDLSEKKDMKIKLGELLGRKGMSLATQKQFDVVRDVVMSLEIKVD